MTEKLKTTGRKAILYELIDLAILYNDRNPFTHAQVNYVGAINGANVIITDAEHNVISMVYLYFGGGGFDILAQTLDKDFETAKNLLK